MPPKTYDQIIKEQQRRVPLPGTYNDIPVPPPAQDPFSLQEQMMKSVPAGGSMKMKIQSTDPNSVNEYNQRLENVRNYNRDSWEETINRVAESVAENIRASERTAQILKGSAYEDRDFFGGMIGREITHPIAGGGDPNSPGNQRTQLRHEWTPLPLPVDTEVKYMEPPKYDPKKNTIEVGVSKREPGSPSGPRIQRDLTLEHFGLDSSNDTGTGKAIDADQFQTSTSNPRVLPMHLYGKGALIAGSNLVTLTGKDVSSDTIDVRPNYGASLDPTISKYGLDRNNLKSNKSLVYNKAMDIYAVEEAEKLALKDKAFREAIWGNSDQRATRDGNIVLRMNNPYKISEHVKYNGVDYPVIQYATQGQMQDYKPEDIEKLYKDWKVNHYGDKFGPKQFADAVASGQIVAPNGINLSIKLKSDVLSKMETIAKKIYDRMNWSTINPGELKSGTSTAKQKQLQSHFVNMILVPMMLGQTVPGGYTENDLQPRKD